MMDATQIVVILVTAGINVAVTLAVLRVELRYLRRDVDAAHRRLDALHAPGEWRTESRGDA